jgi:hypothetical protein
MQKLVNRKITILSPVIIIAFVIFFCYFVWLIAPFGSNTELNIATEAKTVLPLFVGAVLAYFFGLFSERLRARILSASDLSWQIGTVLLIISRVVLIAPVIIAQELKEWYITSANVSNVSEVKLVMEGSSINLNAPLESFRGREEELYDQIFIADNPQSILTSIDLLVLLNTEEANSLLERLFFFSNLKQEKPTRVSEIEEVITKSLYIVFPHLAGVYNKKSEEEFIKLIEKILDHGTHQAKAVCIFWLPSYNSPALIKPLLKFAFATVKSDPVKSKQAMQLTKEYVEHIRVSESEHNSIEFKLKSVA